MTFGIVLMCNTGFNIPQVNGSMKMMRRVLLFFCCVFIGCSVNEPVNNNEYNVELPTISVQTNTDLEYLSKEEYSSGTIHIDDNEYELQQTPIELRGRGNTTWSFPKKPFQLKFENASEVLGMANARKWIFLAHYSDKSMLRTEFAFNLSRYSNLNWTPESKFIEFILNQEYLGVYQVVEKIEAEENRVNNGQGFLLEVNRPNRIGPTDIYFQSHHHHYTIKQPDVVIGDVNYTLIQDYIETVEDIIFSESFPNTTQSYADLINVDSFVDWFIIHEITKNAESAWSSSCYLNYVPGEKLNMGPVWDFDLSLGNNYNDRSAEGFVIKEKGWYAQLFKDSVFVNQVKSRFDYFYENKGEFLSQIDASAAYLNEAQERNFVKWPILGVWVWPNAVAFTQYDHEIAYLKNWFEERMDWLDIAIDDL